MATVFKSPQWLMPTEANQDNVSNYSMEFDGVDDVITTSAVVTGSDFTLSYWVNANGSYTAWAKFQPVSTKPSNNHPNQSIGYLYAKGAPLYPSLQAYDSTDTTYSVWSALALNFVGAGWHHVVWTHNITTQATYLYVDGVVQTFTHYSSGATTSYLISRHTYTEINIGATWAPSEFLPGLVDEVSVFNSVLSAVNITAIYNSGTPGDITSLSPIAYWKLGEQARFTSQWLVPNSTTTPYSKFSMAFDGVNDSISTGYSYDAAVTPNLSISFWFKTTSAALFEFPISIKTNGGLYNSFYCYDVWG